MSGENERQLLEALDEIRDEAYAHMDEGRSEDSPLNRSLMALARIAERAIAKAEGREAAGLSEAGR